MGFSFGHMCNERGDVVVSVVAASRVGVNVECWWMQHAPLGCQQGKMLRAMNCSVADVI